MSIKSLFGKYCSSNRFAHDIKIDNLALQEMRHLREIPYSQGKSCRSRSTSPLDLVSPIAALGPGLRDVIADVQDQGPAPAECHRQPVSKVGDAEGVKVLGPLVAESDSATGEEDSQVSNASLISTLSEHHSVMRREAYDRMLQNYHGIAWNSIELISTGCNHSVAETEL